MREKRENFNLHSWRSASAAYVSQVPALTNKRLTEKRRNSGYRRLKPQFKVCEKIICIDLKNGSSTTGIIFPNGNVCIGDDVWRLSNKADCCDYPYKRYNNRKLAEQDYEFKETTSLTFCDDMADRRCLACV